MGQVAKTKELLPTNYVSAKQALAACSKVDECKSWADKAMALKSYAKQMKDSQLEEMAQRIRDRAVRRGGEYVLLDPNYMSVEEGLEAGRYLIQMGESSIRKGEQVVRLFEAYGAWTNKQKR
jgi:hypothetical protein